MWTRRGIAELLTKSSLGRQVLEVLNYQTTIKKCNYIRAYYRTEENFSWESYEWSGMVMSGGLFGKTIYVCKHFTDMQAAPILVHEATHAVLDPLGGEQAAYHNETLFQIEAGYPRQRFMKDPNEDAPTGSVVSSRSWAVDDSAIEKFAEQTYEGWYTPSRQKEWKKETNQRIKIDLGNERIVGYMY